MARLNITVSDELAERFRAEIGRRFGAKQGNISMAAEEAFEDWIRKGEKR